jgi:mRNA-decapping enzyme 1B
VVIYVFIQDSQKWERKEVEGALFLVKRSSGPRFRLIVMNRLSTKNLVQDVSSQFQQEIMEPYLIFRCADPVSKRKVIHGIWFPDDDDREKISSLISRIVKSQQQVEVLAQQNQQKNEQKMQQGQRPPPGPGQPMQLLTPAGARPQQPQHASANAPGLLMPTGQFSGDQPPQSNADASAALQNMLGMNTGYAAPPPAAPAPAAHSNASALLGSMLGINITNEQAEQGGGAGAGGALLTPGALFQPPAPAPAAQYAAAAASAAQQPATAGAVDKQALKVALIQLLEDDRFMTMIHSKYSQLIAQVRR